jgi:Lysyl-tRNA synthetase (class II)
LEDQEDKLKAQAQQKTKGDEEAHVEDQDYVEALQYGIATYWRARIWS